MVSEKIEIQDTGLDGIGGSVAYSLATSGYVNMNATNMRVEIDAMGTNHDAKLLDSGVLKASANEIESIKATRLTLNCLMPVTDVANLGFIMAMSRTLGLKQIKGGMGLIPEIPGVQVDDTMYVIIRSIKPTEQLNDSITTVNYIIQLEVVE